MSPECLTCRDEVNADEARKRKRERRRKAASIKEKVAREVRKMRKEMMFHIKDDGMEGCLCVRLLQIGENLDSVE